jgi:hypothetical protein
LLAPVQSTFTETLRAIGDVSGWTTPITESGTRTSASLNRQSGTDALGEQP